MDSEFEYLLNHRSDTDDSDHWLTFFLVSSKWHSSSDHHSRKVKINTQKIKEHFRVK